MACRKFYCSNADLFSEYLSKPLFLLHSFNQRAGALHESIGCVGEHGDGEEGDGVEEHGLSFGLKVDEK